MYTTLTSLLDDYSDIYPDFAILASVAVIIPVSSAPCQRGFSHQNVLKNKLRNRLNPERLNMLMTIRLAGPSCLGNDDLLSAARAFGDMKARQFAWPVGHVCSVWILAEPLCEKTNNLSSDQVWHKPAVTVT